MQGPERAPATARRYRLRGEVGGLVRAFALEAGEQRIGGASECEIVLPVRGVSRRHARVRVRDGVVTVEDDDSRNGTFVAGARVERARLQPGDELRLGPVSLRLESIDALDAELAIDLAGRPEALLGLPPGETAAVDHEPEAVRAAGEGLVFPEGYVAGTSAASASLHAQLSILVQGDLPVLLLGETGVGKECVARSLHLSSSRRGGPFVAVNCAAIPQDLLEAEMFGVVKGAATGVAERAGRFQLAHRGTLLLDEIGELPPPLQAKLLRALQEREIQPVGGVPLAVDVRFVAATNIDLEQRMGEGAFRRDLYYRLAGFVLRVPPLRERKDDLRPLVAGLVRRFARETGKTVRGISVRALDALLAYPWPGNVRELEHEVRRLVYLCADGQPIESTMLSAPLQPAFAGAEPAFAAEPGAGPTGTRQPGSLESQRDALERRLIQETLADCGGNRSAAARRLGISRNGLALKMERLAITD